MKPIINIFKKDFKRRIRSPWGIVILLAIPIFMTALFGVVFGGGADENIKIKLLIEDRDNSFFSQLLLKTFEVPDIKKFIEIKPVKKGYGDEKIRREEASALLIIPEHFTRNFIDQNNNELILIKNPSEQFFPPVIEDLSGIMAKLLSAVSQIFHQEIFELSKLIEKKSGIVERLQFENIFKGSYDKVQKVAKFISPVIISFKSVNISKKKKKGGGLNIFALLLPPISIMFLMFIIEIFLRDILKEKEDGTLRRILYSPVKPSVYVISKIISGWIMGILMFIIMVLFGVIFFGIFWGNYLFLSVIVVVTAFSIAAFFAFLNSIFKDKNQASSVSAPIILVMSAVGGSMIPFDMLPAIVRKFSFLSINYWFMDGTNKILRSEFPINNIVILGIIGVILFLISYRLLIRRISE